MATLHNALKALGPTSFSDIPTSADELDSYLTSLFADSQTIIESVPIAPASDELQHHHRSRSQTSLSSASSASEMSISSARSPEPPPELKELQKEWGKPIKLSTKENALGMSVYKAAGRDGRGAWFARRSVHEGLGFSKFKRGLQREFPESLEAGGGNPGEGNIRGIGGQKKVEDIGVKGRGRVQVWQLSAQFPGPTAPRDFITLLITSSRALKDHHHDQPLGEHGGSGDGMVPDIEPRHYMIISKPCNHPETPPRSGYIRGQYESVEFIREVIQRPSYHRSTAQSTEDLYKQQSGNRRQDNLSTGRDSPSLEKQMFKKNADKKITTFPLRHSNRSEELLRGSRHPSDSTESLPRQRSVTVDAIEDATHKSSGHHQQEGPYDPEENPVEWVMITRSDPGGNVPRFMVERGTPSSIVADAMKFLDWACQKDEVQPGEEPPTPSSEVPPTHPKLMESFSSLEANAHMAGISEAKSETEAFPEYTDQSPTQGSPTASKDGVLATATGAVAAALGAYAPKFVQDQLAPPVSSPKPNDSFVETHRGEGHHEDTASTMSELSFASAESHVDSFDDDGSKAPSISSPSSREKDRSETPTRGSKAKHDPATKVHAHYDKRRRTLEKKLDEIRLKHVKDADGQHDKLKRAEEKHRKEMTKEEGRYRKNLAKIEQKKARELQKEEEKTRKEREKDEKAKLMRERDEALEKVKILEEQVDLLSHQVGDLQRENTGLVAKMGKGDGTTVAAAGDKEEEVGSDEKAVVE